MSIYDQQKLRKGFKHEEKMHPVLQFPMDRLIAKVHNPLGHQIQEKNIKTLSRHGLRFDTFLVILLLEVGENVFHFTTPRNT